MTDRSKDWLHQAARDLEQAQASMRDGRHVPPLLIEKARVLDNFYVATRYVNGHSEGAPFDAAKPAGNRLCQ